MPIYAYECSICGHSFEEMAKMSDPDPPCPAEVPVEKIKSIGSEEVVGVVGTAACGGETSKIISLSSFQLKGSGWYVTDYK